MEEKVYTTTEAAKELGFTRQTHFQSLQIYEMHHKILFLYYSFSKPPDSFYLAFIYSVSTHYLKCFYLTGLNPV